MADISMTYKFEQLDQCSTKMGNIIKSVDTIIDSIKTLGDKAESSWEGTASDAFSERNKELLERLDQLLNEVTTNKDKLDTAVRIQRANEEDIINIVETDLSTNDIF